MKKHGYIKYPDSVIKMGTSLRPIKAEGKTLYGWNRGKLIVTPVGGKQCIMFEDYTGHVHVVQKILFHKIQEI